MEPNLEQLRKNYERFDNNKLIRLATEEATGLRPEALDLLKQIIKERGLSEDILMGIEVQFQEVDEEKLFEYTGLLRKLPCPICKSKNQKLNATMTGTVVSIIIMTNYEKKLIIACPDCLDKENNKAMIKSLLLGWCSFHLLWLIRIPQALIFNYKMKKQNRLSGPNDLFKAFILGRTGRIEANLNNPELLKEMIEYIR